MKKRKIKQKELIEIAKSFLQFKKELWSEEMRKRWVEEEFKKDFNKDLKDMDF